MITAPRTHGYRTRYAPRCVLPALACVLLAGCAPRRTPPAPIAVAPPQRAAPLAPQRELVSADPLAYLELVAKRCAALDQYTIVLTRSEKRGLVLFRSMRGPERIQCWFRRDPFSVRFVWLDESVKYGESTYVAGQQDDLVRFVPRHGLFGLPPGITRVALSTPVTWGEARYPVTDFGLQRLMERILDNIRRAGVAHKLAYLGLARLTDDGPALHRIRVEVPTTVASAPMTELYVDPHTHLPVASRLFAEDGSLEAAYDYTDLDTSVHLTDDDFLLTAERAANPANPNTVADSSVAME